MMRAGMPLLPAENNIASAVCAGAGVNVVTYWCIGLPLAVLLAFPGQLGVAGLWSGLACTTTLQAVVMGTLVHKFDFAHEAKRAAAVAQADSNAKLPCPENGLQLTPLPQPVTAGAVT